MPQHQSETPPLRQRKFPGRRKIVKPRSNPKLPDLTESQNTLTQMPSFISTSSSSGRLSTMLDEIDESDFEDVQPKKKRRKATEEREPGQTTYTQFDRVRAGQIAKNRDVDSQGWQVWADAAARPSMPTLKEEMLQRAIQPVECTDWMDDENDEPVKVDSACEISSRPSTGTIKAPMLGSPGQMNVLCTPRKPRIIEVPSSQSPASVILSTKGSIHSVRFRDAARYPLTSKDGNARLPSPTKRLSPASHNISMKMLQNSRMARLEKRKSDISEALNVEEPKEAPLENEHSSTRTLKRVTTVQDSQLEDLELDDLHDNEDYLRADDNDADQYTATWDLEQATCDPAYSALDRDAARFGWTQTQRVPPTRDVVPDSEDAENRDDGPEGTLSAPQSLGRGDDQDVEIQLLRELGEEVNEASHGSQPMPKINSTSPPADSLLQHSTSDIQIPSSPPPLRPSQISTVVPSQPSPKQPSSPITSPPKSLQSFPQMLSSSPLPRLPWSSPEIVQTSPRANKTKGRDRTQISSLPSLPDFSLPPPPPISSLRSMGGGSSSPAGR